ncbi:hypothetical protein D3C80_1113880 [compost metagenome]
MLQPGAENGCRRGIVITVVIQIPLLIVPFTEDSGSFAQFRVITFAGDLDQVGHKKARVRIFECGIHQQIP